MIKPAFAFFGRRARIALLVTAGAVATVMGAGRVNASTLNWFHDDEAEIAKLTVCYSLGTDAIGRGNLPEGKAIYKPCFTHNAVFSVYYPDTPLSGPPAYSTSGTSSWGDYVLDAFTANGYTATQHLMGSINIHVDDDGDHGTMTSYLHATHVLSDGTIDVANGTYEDEVVRRNGVWKIKTRTLKLIDFLNLGTPTL